MLWSELTAEKRKVPIATVQNFGPFMAYNDPMGEWIRPACLDHHVLPILTDSPDSTGLFMREERTTNYLNGSIQLDFGCQFADDDTVLHVLI